MIAVDRWTAEEALLLLSVKRQSVRQFAEKVGINPRTITHWKNNPRAVCRPVMAQTLDKTLALCTPEEQEAFAIRLAALRGEPLAVGVKAAARPAPCSVVAHKLLPVYVGQRAGALFDAGALRGPGPGGLEQRVLPGGHHSAHASTVHVFACGVVVVHVEEHLRVDTLTELAVWRYSCYTKDPAWAGRRIAHLLQQHGGGSRTCEPAPAPEYMLSIYELREHSWTEHGLDTALQLLATPSVLVNRQDPANVTSLGAGVEEAKFRDGWAHPEALVFDGGGSSCGVASWSGVAYYPHPTERALTMSQIVALELDAQALWALSSHVLSVIEDGRDPVMPREYGWRFIRGAHVRLTTARATETAQHRVMREAILETSELPDRLRAAQDALRDGNS